MLMNNLAYSRLRRATTDRDLLKLLNRLRRLEPVHFDKGRRDVCCRDGRVVVEVS